MRPPGFQPGGPNYNVPHPRLVAAAAALAFFGVALGAFGAHALNLTGKPLETWHTASQYHLAHALAALLCAFLGAPKSGWLFVAGSVVFAGSLYLLVLTDTKWLGAITPLGGVLFLAGWALLTLKALGPNDITPPKTGTL